MEQWTLSAWLSWAEQQHTDGMCFGLERVRTVASHLGLLAVEPIVITVGGTNGKGSCVAFLEQIYTAAGFQVGSFTSPHFLHYNERIRLHGEEVSDEWLCQAFSTIAQAITATNTALTFFEINLLNALWVFKQHALDMILLEVGLGGRLDAVNIIDADLALISSIALDHEAWLGTDRESIAQEKAGILRAQGLAVCGDDQPPHSLIDYARELGASLSLQGNDFGFEIHGDSWGWWNAETELHELPIPKLALDNASSVLQVVSVLQDRLPVKRDAVAHGLKHAKLTGRFQVIHNGTLLTILDVAHNPAAAKYLATQLSKEACSGKTWGLFAIMADKDITGVVQQLFRSIDQWVVADLSIARAAPAVAVQEMLYQQGCRVESQCFTDVGDAYDAILAQAQPEDRVLVFGSFFTVADWLSYAAL
ncbi:Bifunctional protein FolC [Piscirickettsia salmonis]|uniref:bifunctional tetrahydrofolate synthase/dihydrofolate synthase n=1 Tax=Piscirickettsia salmonis TaxID=1238 RepID=UPI0012B6CD8A|nr:bifunctional tetrahydrofolate synthase/dihydrofolate synthase [Piscirickettsia salmonis]QGP50678.1 Bifunctional protein FolC [Piscirickettsia salmonis]